MILIVQQVVHLGHYLLWSNLVSCRQPLPWSSLYCFPISFILLINSDSSFSFPANKVVSSTSNYNADIYMKHLLPTCTVKQKQRWHHKLDIG